MSSIYSWNIDTAIVGNILTTTAPSSIFPFGLYAKPSGQTSKSDLSPSLSFPAFDKDGGRDWFSCLKK